MREKRWPNTKDIIKIERIITKIEAVEIEQMLVDTNKNRHQKNLKQWSKKKHEGATATVFTEDMLRY